MICMRSFSMRERPRSASPAPELVVEALDGVDELAVERVLAIGAEGSGAAMDGGVLPSGVPVVAFGVKSVLAGVRAAWESSIQFGKSSGFEFMESVLAVVEAAVGGTFGVRAGSGRAESSVAGSAFEAGSAARGPGVRSTSGLRGPPPIPIPGSAARGVVLVLEGTASSGAGGAGSAGGGGTAAVATGAGGELGEAGGGVAATGSERVGAEAATAGWSTVGRSGPVRGGGALGSAATGVSAVASCSSSSCSSGGRAARRRRRGAADARSTASCTWTCTLGNASRATSHQAAV
ncbi:MAG: hypothetical protein IPJ77_18660 [Planctomycetes bacterium]|nr:hypothetical protein [Planctomycetota bacterium]